MAKTHKKRIKYRGGGKRQLENSSAPPEPKKFRSLEEFLADDTKPPPDVYSHKVPDTVPTLSKSSEIVPSKIYEISVQIVSILERLERIETHLGIGEDAGEKK